MSEQRELFNRQPTQMQELVERATAPAREYNRKQKQKKYRPKYARFKMKVFYTNDTAYSYYDYAYRNTGELKTDEYDGLLKLVRLLTKKMGEATNIHVWCKMGNDLQTIKQDFNCEVIFWKEGMSRPAYNPTLQFDEKNMMKQHRIKKLERNNGAYVIPRTAPAQNVQRKTG